MIFEHEHKIEKIGEKAGYLLGYLLFTTILFYALRMLDKMPQTWSYFHVMGITIIIVSIGIAINRFLK